MGPSSLFLSSATPILNSDSTPISTQASTISYLPSWLQNLFSKCRARHAQPTVESKSTQTGDHIEKYIPPKIHFGTATVYNINSTLLAVRILTFRDVFRTALQDAGRFLNETKWREKIWDYLQSYYFCDPENIRATLLTEAFMLFLGSRRYGGEAVCIELGLNKAIALGFYNEVIEGLSEIITNCRPDSASFRDARNFLKHLLLSTDPSVREKTQEEYKALLSVPKIRKVLITDLLVFSTIDAWEHAVDGSRAVNVIDCEIQLQKEIISILNLICDALPSKPLTQILTEDRNSNSRSIEVVEFMKFLQSCAKKPSFRGTPHQILLLSQLEKYPEFTEEFFDSQQCEFHFGIIFELSLKGVTCANSLVFDFPKTGYSSAYNYLKKITRDGDLQLGNFLIKDKQWKLVLSQCKALGNSNETARKTNINRKFCDALGRYSLYNNEVWFVLKLLAIFKNPAAELALVSSSISLTNPRNNA